MLSKEYAMANLYVIKNLKFEFGSLGIFKNSIQQYVIFVYSFFKKKYYQKSKTTSCKILSKI